MPTDEQKINWAINGALREGRIDDARSLLNSNPQKRSDDGFIYRSLFSCAMNGNISASEFLLDELGCDVNHEMPINSRESDTVLQQAVRSGNHALVELLLKRGANANIGRPLIGAINIKNRGTEADAISMIRLLCKYGCDVNQSYELMGDKDALFTALDWAGADGPIGETLRELGAKTSDELGIVLPKAAPRKAENEAALRKPENVPSGVAAFVRKMVGTVFGGRQAKRVASEVVDFFEQSFGPVSIHALKEIVPTSPAVEIRVIEPTATRRCLTLFTNGMSSVPLPVGGSGTDYELAELFIELPANWPYRNLANAEFAWPIKWFRWVSRHAHQNRITMDGPVLVVEAKDAISICPGKRFSAMLLLAENGIKRKGRGVIQLYRLFPLYPEEVALAQKESVAALFRAFDTNKIEFVIDLNRRSAVP
jgi:hypothetical protein